MKQKNIWKNKRTYQVLIGIGAVLIFISLFGGNFFSIAYSETPKLKSNVIAKTTISSDFNGEIDSFINDYNSYVIFDTPIILDDNYRKELLESKSFGGLTLPESIIKIIEKNALTAWDLSSLDKGFGESFDKLCKDIDIIDLDLNDEKRLELKDLCEKKGDIIIKEGSKLKLNLPDVDDYEERGGYCERKLVFSAIDVPVEDCIPYELIKIDNGLKLSQLKAEAFEKSGNLIIAMGEEGIKEAESLVGRFNFEQLGFYIDPENKCNEYDSQTESYCFTFSNSQRVVDASEGKIEKISNFRDIFYGITSGKIMRSPTSIKQIILIVGIILLIGGFILYNKNEK